jgi:type IV pilus assembly protein PilC
MKFIFQAKDQTGRTESGYVEAKTREEALDILSKRDIYLLSLEEKGSSGALNQDISLKIFERVSIKEVVIFSKELAIMIESNISPSDALDALAGQTRNKSFRSKILKISSDIRGGTLMSKAFSKYPELFSIFYVNMLKSGEVSGELPRILERVAEHLESDYAMRQKTISAMIYPVMILTIFTLIFIVIMIFVIPNLVTILEGTGQELPFATKIIINTSNFFVNYWYIVLLGFSALAAFAYYYPQTKEGKDLLINAYSRPLYSVTSLKIYT